MTNVFDNLNGTLDTVWALMEEGVRDPSSPARVLAMATQGTEGPEQRMVVLRRADRPSSEIEIHTDTATAKIRALQDTPCASFLLWHSTLRLQARLKVQTQLITGDLTRWNEMPPTAHRLYGGQPQPGQPIGVPEDHVATPDPARFTRVIGQLTKIETLFLGRQGDRRAMYLASDNWVGRWLAP